MKITGRLDAVLLVFTIVKVGAKEPELPLCPTNMPFFPQHLPMHCRMPTGGYPALPNPLQMPTMAPFPPEYYQSPSSDKVPGPIPFPVPPGAPGFPPGFPGFPPGMVGPGPMPMPMPMPMPAPGPAHKLPVIVMPFYSPDPSYKKTKSSHSHKDKSKRYLDVYPKNSHSYDSDHERFLNIYPERHSYESDSNNRMTRYTKKPYEDGPTYNVVEIHRRSHDPDASYDKSRDTSSEGGGFWKGQRGFRRSGRRKNRKHKSKRRRYPKKDLLTPVLQYVTKDGYVIFEKKISKDEAKDWLSMKKTEVQKRDGPEEADLENVNKNNDDSEPNELNEDVEILDGHKDKSKEKVEMQTQRAPKRPSPHKQRNHYTKEQKQKASS